MLLKSIDHITINVTNLEKTFEFYEKVLDLKRLNSVDMGDHTLYYMSLPGECKLELIKYDFENPTINANNTDLGIYRHIAFIVDDIEEIKNSCDKYGVNIIVQPTYFDKFDCKAMLIEDTNGVEIELIQKA